MAHDREVSGIRCTEVLERLSSYVDGELPAFEVLRIEGHLRGCDWCERFGSRFQGVIKELREQLGSESPGAPDDVAARLAARLERDGAG